MTTKNDTQSDTEKVTESTESESTERWEYGGRGSGHVTGEMFTALLEDVDTAAQIYPVRHGRVHLGVICGDRDGLDKAIEAGISLSPDDAERLARDLLEVATVAREDGEQ